MFEQHYEIWVEEQRKTRGGEALRKLNEDHGHAEKLFLEQVWWPLFGQFDCLFPEHEVPHARNSSYYLDYAYIRPPHRINWEIDDFGSHAKTITRRGFDYERDRQNYLQLDGWNIYRFTLDALKERPLQCRQFIQQVMGRLYGTNPDASHLTLKQREIIRLALRTHTPITPAEVCEQVGVKSQHARKLLQDMVKQRLLKAHSGKKRIRSYSLGPKAPTWI